MKCKPTVLVLVFIIISIVLSFTSKNNKNVFYTGDTGPGLSALWDYISPQVVIWDLTFPNSLENRAINSAHLCPRTLKNELLNFYQIKNYYPRIYLIHLSPKLEKEIKREVKEVSNELDVKINITREGEKIEI